MTIRARSIIGFLTLVGTSMAALTSLAQTTPKAALSRRPTPPRNRSAGACPCHR
jgi:hypothetical protein